MTHRKPRRAASRRFNEARGRMVASRVATTPPAGPREWQPLVEVSAEDFGVVAALRQGAKAEGMSAADAEAYVAEHLAGMSFYASDRYEAQRASGTPGRTQLIVRRRDGRKVNSRVELRQIVAQLLPGCTAVQTINPGVHKRPGTVMLSCAVRPVRK